MASRLIAGFVLIAGVVALAAVGFRGDPEPESIIVASAAPAEAETSGSSDAAEAPEGDAPVAEAEATTTTAAPEIELDNYGPRKDLINLDGWLNTENTSIDEFDGKVLVVEMWTFGCHNCRARIPHTQALYASHSRDDFEIIGVHAPEFDHEAIIPNIVEAVDRLEVTWPVAIDTEKTNFRGWQDGGRRFWPRTYVIDQNGDVRYDHIGEGRYQELADTVQFLVDNPPAATTTS